MKAVVVVPYVYKPYFDEFIKTVKIPEQTILTIDNTVNNIGIMKSHNKGVSFMKKKKADWLIIMSASIRFGENGGLDFVNEVMKSKSLILHGAGLWKTDPEQRTMALGWHCTAFRREIFEQVGNWDENFSNYSLDDVDLTMRIQKYFGKDYRNEQIEIDMWHESTAHSVNLAHIKACAYAPRHSYFMRKWGKDSHDWQLEGYATPFNLDKSLDYWPRPNDPLSIFQNEYKTGGYNFED